MHFTVGKYIQWAINVTLVFLSYINNSTVFNMKFCTANIMTNQITNILLSIIIIFQVSHISPLLIKPSSFVTFISSPLRAVVPLAFASEIWTGLWHDPCTGMIHVLAWSMHWHDLVHVTVTRLRNLNFRLKNACGFPLATRLRFPTSSVFSWTGGLEEFYIN